MSSASGRPASITMRADALFDLGRGMPVDPGLLSRSAVIAIYLALYLKDATSAWVGPAVPMIILGVGLTLGAAAIGMRMRLLPSSIAPLGFTGAGLAMWIMAMATNAGLNSSPYYIGLFCAFVLVQTDVRFFLRLLAVHAVISVLIEIFEVISQSYFFVYVDPEGVALDEDLFGGSVDILRAKGLFQGPLSAVAFAIWIALLARRNIAATLLLMAVSLLASGRLGLALGALLLAIRMWAPRGVDGQRSGLGLGPGATVAALAIALGLLMSIGGDRADFISAAFDLGSDQNLARMFFWLTSIENYLSYPAPAMLFGNFGFVLRGEGATENDFLRMLLDNGALCFVLYACALVTLWRTRRSPGQIEAAPAVLFIAVAMNLFPFIQSMSSAVLFWVFCFRAWDSRFLACSAHRVDRRSMTPSPTALAPSPALGSF